MRGRSLNSVEGVTLAYNGAILAFLLLFYSRIPQWHLWMLPNLVAIAAVLLLATFIRDQAAPFPGLVRNLAPLAFFAPLYLQTGAIHHVIFPDFLDPWFVRIEAWVFGFQPSTALAERFPHPWLSEYMHFAYASYYALFPGLAVFLYLRRARPAFLDYMFSLCATMYVCLLTYVLLPVRGPIRAEMDGATDVALLPFTAGMAWVYRHLETEGAAFPSSHVAIAALVLIYTVRYARPAVWVVGPLVISLIVSTVYCGYHYAIDVLAGLATVAVLLPLWRRVNGTVKP